MSFPVSKIIAALCDQGKGQYEAQLIRPTVYDAVLTLRGRKFRFSADIHEDTETPLLRIEEETEDADLST